MSSPQYQYLMPEQYEVTPQDFARASSLLRTRAGILVGAHKQEMAARTLGMSAKRLGLDSISAYLEFLTQHPDSTEWNTFVNAFTVNHTAFFREQHHFKILADFLRTRPAPIAIWTCAASTGEEAYSIAMTLQETVAQASTRAWVWGTDIDTDAIKRAKRGVYPAERVSPVPEAYLKKYFYRGKGAKKGMVRVKPVLHDMVRFEPLNLLSPVWPQDQKFDAIFCRNTMIYFDKKTQADILNRLAPMLKEGGLLFAGHSENFTYLTTSLQLRGQTVYTAAGA